MRPSSQTTITSSDEDSVRAYSSPANFDLREAERDDGVDDVEPDDYRRDSDRDRNRDGSGDSEGGVEGDLEGDVEGDAEGELRCGQRNYGGSADSEQHSGDGGRAGRIDIKAISGEDVDDDLKDYFEGGLKSDSESYFDRHGVSGKR